MTEILREYYCDLSGENLSEERLFPRTPFPKTFSTKILRRFCQKIFSTSLHKAEILLVDLINGKTVLKF